MDGVSELLLPFPPLRNWGLSTSTQTSTTTWSMSSPMCVCVCVCCAETHCECWGNEWCVYGRGLSLHVKTEDEPTRAIAGLILKNNVKVYYASFPAEIKSFIKQEAIQAIGDPSLLICATAGTLISTIAMQRELAGWPELLPTLCHFIDDPNYTTCEVMRSAVCCGVLGFPEGISIN